VSAKENLDGNRARIRANPSEGSALPRGSVLLGYYPLPSSLEQLSSVEMVLCGVER